MDKNRRRPERAANRGDGIAEGRLALVIPSGGSGTDGAGQGAGELVGPHRDQGEQSEQRRRRVRDDEVGSLPLRFHPEVGAGLLERRFHVPARDEPIAQDTVDPSWEVGAGDEACLSSKRVADRVLRQILGD